MKRMPTHVVFLTLLLALGFRTTVIAQAAPAAPAPSAAQQPDGELVTVPYPDMSGLEEAVREQINDAHGELQSWLRKEDKTTTQIAAAYSRLGRILHAYELYDAAEACYLNALRLGSPSFQGLYYLADVYQKGGKFEKAAAAYMAALKIDGSSVPALVNLGKIYQAQNRSEEAAKFFRLALEKDPTNPAAQANLGEMALAAGDHKTAVELLSDVLERVPAANRLHYPLAMAFRGLGEQEKALEHLDQIGTVGLTVEDPWIKALRDLATGERIHLLRGRQAFNAGQYGEAATAFRQALQADPKSVRVWVNLGSALGQMGDVLGAIEQYEKALELAPANVTAQYNLGLLKAQQGKHEAAVGHFRSAIDLKADDGGFYYQLGLGLRRLGRMTEALEELHTATTFQIRNEGPWLDKTSVLVELKRYKEALETLEEAARNMPQSGQISHALARLLSSSPDKSLRDGARALDLARRVYEAAPSPGHAITVAEAMAEAGRCGEAAEWLSQLMKVAEEQGQNEWVVAQRGVLERYQAGAPCN